MHRIASSPRPVDRTAARVLFAKNWYTPNKKIANEDQDHPFRCTDPLPGSKDRTGQRKGDLVVVGFYQRKDKKRHLWACRCVCGRYTLRTGDSLSKNSQEDRCEHCRHARHLQDRIAYLTRGAR